MRAEATSLPALLRRRSAMPRAPPDAPGACIYPNRTLYNIETPDCYFRRFTPDGKYLIGFGRNMNGLHVFHVQGSSASTRQLIDAGTTPSKGEFRHFFKPAWSRSYTGVGEALHRDLCLVTSNMRHLIIVRLRRADFGAMIDRQQHQHQQQASHLPSALSSIKAMEDITVLVLSLSNGDVVDRREYLSDIIYLSGHNGISLYEDKLCLLSLKNQCLRILRINSDGTLIDEREIGWHTQPDDAYYDDMLRMREEAHLAAQRKEMLLRKRGLASSEGFGGCLDDADIPLAIKRQKTTAGNRATVANLQHPNRRPRIGGSEMAGTYGAPVHFTPEALDPGPSQPRWRDLLSRTSSSSANPVPRIFSSDSSQAYNDIHCPEMPTDSFMSSATSVCFPSERTGERLPFIFPFSSQAQGLLSGGNEAGDALAPMQPSLFSNEPSMHPLSESLSQSLLTMPSDRMAALMPLQALQRLPPHYRLMFTRAMQPTSHLDSLADSDVLLVEPSLASAPYNGLKQRLLGALFMRAKSKDDGGLALKCFYRIFRQYEALVLWRAQFVTRNRLLLRFVPLQIASSRSHMSRASVISSNTMANSFTVLAEYDIVKARFGRIWDTAERDLYREVEDRWDVYRAPMASSGGIGATAAGAHAPSLSNDLYLRDSFEFTQAALRTSRSGGPVQATRKASALLPIAPQCTQESPILNPYRFKCNMRMRQMIERFRPASMSPIRFYDRFTGSLRFVLAPTPHHSSPPLSETDSSVAAAPAPLLPLDATTFEETFRGGGGGGGILPSGAILMSSGGTTEDVGGIAAGSTSSSALGGTNSVSTGGSGKPGIMYLLHPFLPLVLSSRSDNGPNTLPTSNIHFWQG
ncbi:hypothetical protein GGH99_003312 [Coemansia sp. RSA 1285]|nr:hypothetical protein GGH99_003312 [Coemansia sp. RSA 1285]